MTWNDYREFQYKDIKIASNSMIGTNEPKRATTKKGPNTTTTKCYTYNFWIVIVTKIKNSQFSLPQYEKYEKKKRQLGNIFLPPLKTDVLLSPEKLLNKNNRYKSKEKCSYPFPVPIWNICFLLRCLCVCVGFSSGRELFIERS